MNKVFKLIMAVLLVLNGYGYAAALPEEETWEIIEGADQPGRLKLYNNTKALTNAYKGWRFQVNYTLNGKRRSKLIYPNEIIDLGEISKLSPSISIMRYGEVWGVGATPYTIDLSTIKKRPTISIKITITAGWKEFKFTESIISPEEAALSTVAIDNPWKAFPRVIAKITEGAVVQPRHVFNIPENADSEIIDNAYRELILTWHPDKNPNPHAKEVSQIITDAHTILTKVNELKQKIKATELIVNELHATLEEKKGKLTSEEYNRIDKEHEDMFRALSLPDLFTTYTTDDFIIDKTGHRKPFKRWDTAAIERFLADADMETVMRNITRIAREMIEDLKRK